MHHVPDNFFSKTFAVSGILTCKWLRKIIQNTAVTWSFGFVGNILIGILALLFGLDKKKAIGYITLVKYGDGVDQEELVKLMMRYYPLETGFAGKNIFSPGLFF